jgi:hypothetical protein
MEAVEGRLMLAGTGVSSFVAAPVVRFSQPVRRAVVVRRVGAAVRSSAGTGISTGRANTESVGTAGGANTDNSLTHGTGALAGFNTNGTRGVGVAGGAMSTSGLPAVSLRHFAF